MTDTTAEALFGLGERVEQVRREIFTTQFLLVTMGIVILAHVWKRSN